MTSAYATILFAALFLVILTLLHFLKKELDSSWRMISEYGIGRFGWIMRIAFSCWGVRVIALLVTVWLSLQSVSGMISRWWFVIIAIALYRAGIFKTDPIIETTSNIANTLHALCGAIVILTFPIAATLAVHGLLQYDLWQTGQSQMVFGTVLAWIGMIAFFASITISRKIDPSAGWVGPHIYLGWPNRFMVVTYVLWLIIIARTALRL